MIALDLILASLIRTDQLKRSFFIEAVRNEGQSISLFLRVGYVRN